MLSCLARVVEYRFFGVSRVTRHASVGPLWLQEMNLERTYLLWGLIAILCMVAEPGSANDYEIGEGAGMLAAIGDVPWESLQPGDRVLIHWSLTPLP